MSAISTDDRRDVARRLRKSAGTAPYMNTSDDFAREVFRAAMNESVGDYRAAVDRLAVLIEPDEPPYNLYTLYEAVFHRSPRCCECIEDDEVDELVDALLDICNAPGHEHIQRFQPSEPKVKCVAEVKVDGERLEKLVRDAVAEVTGIDRDALLELADECGDASRAYAADGHELTSRQFANVARRIREALGVQDA